VTAHPLVLLAIDPAAVSGWAIFISGELHSSGVATTQVDRMDVVNAASCCASVACLPLVVIAETWSFGGNKKDPRATAAMQAGLQAKWGLWEAAIEESDGKIKVVRVNSRRWQTSVLTRLRVRSETLKQIARHSASNLAHRPIEDENEADAICIGFYGTISPITLAKLTIAEGKRLGVDVVRARAIVASEKTQKRATKAAKKLRKVSGV
jgi:hypothetical protein